MSASVVSNRPFQPGTTGWTASDLDDPRIEAEWLQGRHEIVEGVLTTMPPAYFAGGSATFNLLVAIRAHLVAHGLSPNISIEVDIVIDETRVVVADAVLLNPEDKRRQEDAAQRGSGIDSSRTRILVPPTLVIESVSPGHESHDRRTKRKWYAEFGVRNYWIVDAYQRSLDCLVLDAADYRVDVVGRQSEQLNPSCFPGLSLELAELWKG